MALKKITVLESQTLKDIAIQYYGNIEGINELIKLNDALNWSTILVAGSKLFIDNDNIVEQKVVEVFEKKLNKPASGANLYITPNPNIFDNTFSNNFN